MHIYRKATEQDQKEHDILVTKMTRDIEYLIHQLELFSETWRTTDLVTAQTVISKDWLTHEGQHIVHRLQDLVHKTLQFVVHGVVVERK